MWSFSSGFVKPFNASGVVTHSWRAERISRCGAGGGPFFLREEGLPCESREVVEVLSEDLRCDRLLWLERELS